MLIRVQKAGLGTVRVEIQGCLDPIINSQPFKSSLTESEPRLTLHRLILRVFLLENYRTITPIIPQQLRVHVGEY